MPVFQVLMTFIAHAAMKSYNQRLHHEIGLNSETIKQFRKEHKVLMRIVQYLNSVWTYYYFVFQMAVAVTICMLLYLISHGQEIPKYGLGSWLALNIIFFMALFVSPIVLNEEIEKSIDILMDRDVELHLSDETPRFDGASCDELDYRYHVRMLR